MSTSDALGPARGRCFRAALPSCDARQHTSTMHRAVRVSVLLLLGCVTGDKRIGWVSWIRAACMSALWTSTWRMGGPNLCGMLRSSRRRLNWCCEEARDLRQGHEMSTNMRKKGFAREIPELRLQPHGLQVPNQSVRWKMPCNCLRKQTKLCPCSS